MMKIHLGTHLNRFTEYYPKGSDGIPATLRQSAQTIAPDAFLRQIELPLPSKRHAYKMALQGRDGTVWLGASTGVTRYDPNAPRKQDRVQYFSAERDLLDNDVRAMMLAPSDDESVYESIWVQTKTGATRITLRWLDPEEKANILLEESLRVVDRRGMYSQRGLSVPLRPETALPFNESDNDGCFGSGFAIAELLHYATLKRELGADHPETQRIRKIVTRASEAQLLLLYMPCRGDGFAARTYLLPTEPIPNGGMFFRKMGDGTAEVVTTHTSLENNTAGKRIPCTEQVPARLAKLYEDEGYTEKGLVYKGDTSSDEITLHFSHLYFLHMILGQDDPELDELAVNACRKLMRHIIDHGFELYDAFGEPTTWAKWSERYFQFGNLGWCDACLNAAEVLMYLQVTKNVTGEDEPWQSAYDALIAKGYDDITQWHCDRLHQSVTGMGIEESEEIMYGDHMLATMAFWMLINLTPEGESKEKFRRGYAAWRGSIGREHNAGYDFPFLLSCPDASADMDMLAFWFERHPVSRLATSVSATARHDMPERILFGKTSELGWLLPPDECSIAKYDRSPHSYRNREGGAKCVESCYVYTFAYWIGRWYGFIA
ncbi:MAG: hypothetical protein LBB67_07620 [Oscillospiraceae bacterium]|jgi:hypothetical protein|nr:hypothetical protein [Oscillospiraceae bacterium]